MYPSCPVTPYPPAWPSGAMITGIHYYLTQSVVGFLFVFGDRVLPCSPGCPGTCYKDQASLKQRYTHLYLLRARLKGVHHHTQKAWSYLRRIIPNNYTLLGPCTRKNLRPYWLDHVCVCVLMSMLQSRSQTFLMESQTAAKSRTNHNQTQGLSPFKVQNQNRHGQETGMRTRVAACSG